MCCMQGVLASGTAIVLCGARALAACNRAQHQAVGETTAWHESASPTYHVCGSMCGAFMKHVCAVGVNSQDVSDVWL